MKHTEYNLQKQVCRYLELQYSEVLFLSDTIANLKLSIPQQVRNKAIQKKDFHCPDLLILQPNEKYKGLFLELKIKSPFKKNGELYKNEHLENQQRTINELNNKGYKSLFVWSFEMAKEEIDNYLNKR